jgi:hypothetical protein
MPQGSVLEPLFSIVYVLPFGCLIANHGIDNYHYAYDTQMFVAKCASNIQMIYRHIGAVFTVKLQLFADSSLALNPDKSEVMFVGTSSQLKAAYIADVIFVAGAKLPVSIPLESYSVILNSRLTFDAHVTAVCYYLVEALRYAHH